MLILFEAGGLHPRMAYVLDGEAASASPKHALALVGSPSARVRSGVNRVVLTRRRPRPVYSDKQTFLEADGMSQRCQ
jgi:hypothetical protein